MTTINVVPTMAPDIYLVSNCSSKICWWDQAATTFPAEAPLFSLECGAPSQVTGAAGKCGLQKSQERGNAVLQGLKAVSSLRRELYLVNSSERNKLLPGQY